MLVTVPPKNSGPPFFSAMVSLKTSSSWGPLSFLLTITFVAPTSGQSLTLRLKHSGRDRPLKVTLGSTLIQLNPSFKSSLTIDDITLYPIPGPSESDHLSFKPGIRNDIVIQFTNRLGVRRGERRHLLHDIELLDEAGLEDPRNQIIIAD
jgi:hypothetical protein